MGSTTIYHRLLQPPRQSFFLFGMRGVGKSTWARQLFPQAPRFDLLDEGLFQSYLRDPSLFGRELQRLSRGQWVLVDEVQRLPWLLNEVHRFIEERGLRFALLGSSARKLKQAGTNLLAGRALRRVMFPFLPQELGADFDLADVLRFGSLPIIWQAGNKAEALEAYVQLYLKEEIQAEAIVRNLPGFARFLPIAALFHGQVLNVAGLARDAGGGGEEPNQHVENPDVLHRADAGKLRRGRVAADGSGVFAEDRFALHNDQHNRDGDGDIERQG